MNRVFGVGVPAVFLLGVALAGWLTFVAFYAWAAREAAWLVLVGIATLLALAAPLALMVSYERWQLGRRGSTSTPDLRTKSLDVACGLFAAVLGLLVLPLALLSAYFAWVFWSDGVQAASLYFAVVALAVLAQPAGFYYFFDRWQARNHLQDASAPPCRSRAS